MVELKDYNNGEMTDEKIPVYNRVKGKIVIKTEDNGKAYYVHPLYEQIYYLGRPSDAFDIMRNLGLGIAHNELQLYLNSNFPSRLSGMIMLDVENNGEAYYVYPEDLKGYYLGRPADALRNRSPSRSV